MKPNRRLTIFRVFFCLLTASVLLLYFAQFYWAHRCNSFLPDYPKVPISEDTDYETLFLQTGLGRSAVDQLLASNDFDTILAAQNALFHPPATTCSPLLGWFTREDRLPHGTGFPPIELQPGDILLTLSTHTAGWRHGHAALVLGDGVVLESIVLGTDSTTVSAAHWSSYSDYAVLRVKNAAPQQQQQVAQFALTHLTGRPYRLSAGWLGDKAPDVDAPYFGLHCSYLVWYAWNRFGYDLDSDGGRLVTANDLLFSDQLEMVQLCGMDPRKFLDSRRSQT